jgi:CheY-like chemotaxis protein
MEIQHDHYRGPGAAEILIVDDHREITEMVAEALLDEGYSVRVAHDGLAALGEIERRRPDLLLLDVGMPLMSGDEVLARLRGDEQSRLPVILMTADRTPERFCALGADQILRKPFDIGRLLQLVARYTGYAAPLRLVNPAELRRPVEREVGL